MNEFLIAMSPVIAIWAMLLGPVVYVGIRGALRIFVSTVRAVAHRPAVGSPSGPVAVVPHAVQRADKWADQRAA
jgi:hypothetical protein